MTDNYTCHCGVSTPVAELAKQIPGHASIDVRCHKCFCRMTTDGSPVQYAACSLLPRKPSTKPGPKRGDFSIRRVNPVSPEPYEDPRIKIKKEKEQADGK
jgi:hypothetical protein